MLQGVFYGLKFMLTLWLYLFYTQFISLTLFLLTGGCGLQVSAEWELGRGMLNGRKLALGQVSTQLRENRRQ